MKVFGASLFTETNTFSPMPTTMKHFEQCYLTYNGKHNDPPHFLATPLLCYSKLSRENGWEYIESICAGAQPAGPVVRNVYETLRDRLLHDLNEAMPVNLVLLSLHGGMIADGYDDCEGDILSRVRKIVGQKVTIGVQLDPHSHLTDEMVHNADILISMKEYPHTDFEIIAKELFQLSVQNLLGEIMPNMAVYDCHMIGIFPTTHNPMKNYVVRIKALEEADADVLSISVIHGFPWGDVPDIGTKILVLTNNKLEKGLKISERLGQELCELRDSAGPTFSSVDEVLDMVETEDVGPVVLADFADNPGGGAFGDSTFLLDAILKRKMSNVAISAIWDPISVSIAVSAGEGAHLKLRIGGKMSRYSGNPVDLDVEIKKIVSDLKIEALDGGVFNFGTAVWARVGSIDIVLNDERCQTYSTDCFSKIGIDPTKKKVLIVKSSQNFRASFEKISKKILIVITPGTLCPDFTLLPYYKVRREVYPIAKNAYVCMKKNGI